MRFSEDSLRALVNPASIAIVGASDNPARVGGMPLSFLKQAGYRGALFPVNPNRDTVQGLKAYPTISDLPEAADLAILVVRAELVPGELRKAAKRGVRSAIIFSAGFAETGAHGAALQSEVQKVSADYGIPVLGPNCAGLVNIEESTIASFGSHLAASTELLLGGIGIVSQSGAVGSYLLTLTRQLRIGLSYWITTGNEAVTSIADYVSYLATDDRTSVISIYAEQIHDVEQFAAACTLARSRNKHIVLLVGGTSPESEEARRSHTAALATDYRLLRALIEDLGIRQVESLSELLTVSVALEKLRFPTQGGVGVLTMSGAAGVLVTDRCAAHGVSLARLAAETQQALTAVVPFAGVSNPVDVTGNVANDPESFATFLRVLSVDANVSSLIVFLGHLPLSPHIRHTLVDALLAHSASSELPTFLIALLDPEDEFLLRDAGIQVFTDPADAVDTIAAISASTGPARALVTRRERDVALPALQCSPGGDAEVLNEADSQDMLAELGFVFPRRQVALSAREAEVACAEIGGPAVLKVLSPDIQHKSDVGGVRLNVNAGTAATVYTDLLDTVGKNAPGSRVDGVLVQEQIPDGLPVMIGARVDPQYGPVVVFGWGGVFAEYFSGSVTVALAPVNVEEARALIPSGGFGEALSGVRGSAYDARNDLAEAISALATFVWDYRAVVADVEINPLLLSNGRLVAVDAVVHLQPKSGTTEMCADSEDE